MIYQSKKKLPARPYPKEKPTKQVPNPVRPPDEKPDRVTPPNEQPSHEKPEITKPPIEIPQKN